MTCREVVEYLAEYLVGGLPTGERTVFDEHLAVCPECVNYIRTYEQTIRLTKGAIGAPDGSEPSDPPPQLIAAILAARQAS